MARSDGTVISTPIDYGLGSGKYHHMQLSITTTSVRVTIGRPRVFPSLFREAFDQIRVDVQRVYIGGYPGDVGLMACVKNFKINQNRFEVQDLPTENRQNVRLGECALVNRCNGICSHGGTCYRTREDVRCDCEGTMYGGPSCHTPLYPKTCDQVVFPENVDEMYTVLDVDGTGLIQPVTVKCVEASGTVETVIENNVTSLIGIDGFQEPGSYRRDIEYKVEIEAAIAIINRAKTCCQFVSYKCVNSTLMASPPGSSKPYGWWVGRNNAPHYYWGGAPPESRNCSCSTTQAGCVEGLGCNCDAGLSTQQTDEGCLSNKKDLPVTQVRFGDTGDKTDAKTAEFQIMDVKCSGDAVLEKTVTLRSLDSSIYVWGSFVTLPVDVSFQFKTTMPKAQLFFIPVGHWNFISVMMTASNRIRVDMTTRYIEFQKEQPFQFHLNDNFWHTIYFEVSTKRALLRVDGSDYNLWEPMEPVYQEIHVGRSLIIGGNSKGTFGFAGCIRDVVFNGKEFDIVDIVNKDDNNATVPGCAGQCSGETMCQNGGTCTEYYATYMCDCSTSAFSGCYCGNAVGVTFPAGSYMRFNTQTRLTPSHSFRSLELHFRTSQTAGVLAHVSGNAQNELLTLELNPAGNVVLTYRPDNNQSKTMTSAKALADGSSHKVTVSVMRSQNNATDTWQVMFDDETQTQDSAQLLTTLPGDLYLASKSTTPANGGFTGCIFGLKYNGETFLKEVRTTPKPDYITYSSNVNPETTCGDMEPAVQSTGLPGSLGSKKPVSLQFFGPFSRDPMTVDTALVQVNSLLCEASPMSRYTITQNGEPVACPHLLVEDNKLLLPPDDRVAGQYQCMIDNGWTQTVSDYSTVLLARPPKVDQMITESVILGAGQYARLSCNVSTGSVPEAETQWLAPQGTNPTDPRFYQAVNGDLHIVSVDANDSGTFKCSKFNADLGVTVEVKTITVTVNAGPGGEEPIQLLYSSPNITVDVHSHVILECLLSATDPSVITWEKADRNETTDRLVNGTQGRQLVLSYFEPNDAGKYFCKFENDTVATITVDLSAKPTWENGPMDTVVYMDQTAELYCKVRSVQGDPAPNTTWFINGQPLQESPRYKLNDEGDMLTITNVSKATDILAFQCNVSNELGYVYGTGSLHVVAPTVITEAPKSKIMISPEDLYPKLRVKCENDVDTNLTFTWYHDNEKVENGNQKYYFTTKKSKSTLQLVVGNFLNNLDVLTGAYKCVIDDGIKNHTVSSLVELKPDAGGGSGIQTTTPVNVGTKASCITLILLYVMSTLTVLTVKLM
ncbi:neurexin-4-like isoform X2 [Liolophura sinensis]